MTKSKLILDILNENVNLENILLKLKVLFHDLDDKNIITWVDNELKGYRKGNEVPSYRIIKTTPTMNITNGALILKGQLVPVSQLPKDVSEVLGTHEVKEGVKGIERMIESSKVKPIGVTYGSTYIRDCIAHLYDHPVQVTSLSSIYSLGTLEGILGNIKTTILEIVLELDSTYGNFDNYDIFTNKTVEEKEEVSQKVIKIIMGDNNTITGSNLGEVISK